ncbi:uracil-DNA glycosylase [Streptomyces brasiliensis]|uniref:Type-5 uracil-DNA glycosylase n=1 Tax=Streptomyces brasiliensis TaxID=1954 RepID=A0A917KIL9_9ACTN|nr:uracil-DNA glycosylase [Streptomyces brasiliensis]GGJ12796.1 uracil-DNA glycosylase [Streptomyces brasiliensis]
MRGGHPVTEAHDFPAVTAPRTRTVRDLDAAVATCRACPRLVAWREEIARVKRGAFREWEYWARPVPGFGPPDAKLAIIGLAPAAHGGNRTGRIFTGDPSGDALYAALYDIALASQPTAAHRDDGMELYAVRITVPVHCAPPGNRPTTTERDTCRPWLAQELELLRPTLRAIVVLGAFAWQALLPVLADAGWQVPRPRPAFGHGAEVRVRDAGGEREVYLIGGYHPSRRNMSTRTLTPAMLRDVLRRGAQVAGLPARPERKGPRS